MPNHWTEINHVWIGGTRAAVATRRQLVQAMVNDSLAARGTQKLHARTVFDTNGHGISLNAKDSSFHEALLQADIVHVDGGFLVAASALFCKTRIPERSATTDLIHDAAFEAANKGISFYLLGGPDGLAKEAAATLQETYPKLRIAGTHHGYFSADEERDVIEDINESGADVVWVGLGKPHEQLFCCRNSANLSVAWLVTCGGCFNYITGDYPRAPTWMQRSGFEWLHRMMTNPRQLFWRYLSSNPHALWLTLRFRGKPAPGTKTPADF
ncbi:WecB/TagA/CpsF family glycosyltransferase [Parvibaculaceae bacterium PLY_AMNH_Bact1]|nr:WecB/TagA/CpsF family glycosyltransferase [Parvibaculaceae bacterium PLY_AMNH_Bact1]